MTRQMKDSGIEWIGRIPENRKLLRVKYDLLLIKGKNPSELNIDKIGSPYIGASDLDKERLSNEYENYTTEDLPSCEYEDILILWDGARAGLIGRHHVGVISSTIVNVIPNENKILKEFYYWNLKGFEKYLYDMVNGTTIPHMNRRFLNDIFIIDFTLDDQSRIANYLDNKCTKIDETIEKEKQVIEKLNEYKQSVITEAVTKGINPNVKMKDSGIEWIGEIPEHWKITKISGIAHTSSGSIPLRNKAEEYYDNAKIKWVRTLDLNNGYVYETSENITKEALENSSCSIMSVNTVMVAMYGGAGTIGKCGILKSEAATNQAVCSICCKKVINPLYMLYTLITLKKYWMKYAVGTRKDPNISQNIVSNMKIIVPEIKEQKEITDYLDKKCDAIGKAIFNKEKIIEKLTEYKKSLIYECVTGKREV